MPIIANQSGVAPAGVLEAMAALVHSVRFEDLPAEVVSAVTTRVLDTLGCAFGALNSDVGQAVRRMAADCGGAPQSTLIGTGEKTSAPLATLVNGSLLRYLDSNDYYFARDPAHPSGNLAVALAVGECHRRSGRDMLAVLVAAYEVHLRLCDFAGEPSLWRRGWHHATNAQFAGAAGASPPRRRGGGFSPRRRRREAHRARHGDRRQPPEHARPIAKRRNLDDQGHRRRLGRQGRRRSRAARASRCDRTAG